MDGQTQTQTQSDPGSGLAELFQHVVNEMKVYTWSVICTVN